jgi:tetratricopeptide (TPR) repeat protein
MRLKISLVAAALVLLSIGVVYWQNQQPQRLYQQFSQRSAPPTHSQRASFSQPTHTPIEKAVQALNRQEYDQAQAYAATILQSDPNQTQAQLIFGYTLLQKGDFERAKPHLFAAAESSQEPFNADAAWFLALAYLQDDNQKASLHFLQLNIRVGSVYSGLAQELLVAIGA